MYREHTIVCIRRRGIPGISLVLITETGLKNRFSKKKSSYRISHNTNVSLGGYVVSFLDKGNSYQIWTTKDLPSIGHPTSDATVAGMLSIGKATSGSIFLESYIWSLGIRRTLRLLLAF
jgi:hypothetical protein